jgi:hypothetical protein
MPCAPPPADPFAPLTQAQRDMWARCSLPFELTSLVMRRPCDLKLGHEITSVVNDLGITWPPPRSGGGGGNAQAELVDLTPGDEDDDVGDQDGNVGGSTGGGNAGGNSTGGGNKGGGSAGGGNKGSGTLEAFVKPGVVTFNSGYTSNWGLSIPPQQDRPQARLRQVGGRPPRDRQQARAEEVVCEHVLKKTIC